MNIQQALDMADGMKPNMMDDRMKIAFLQEIDRKIFNELVMTHEHTPEEEVPPKYDNSTDRGTELLVPDPYGMLYVYWIMTLIDQQNQETEKENNDRARFDNEYQDMSDWWTRTRMPLQARKHFCF